MINDRRTGRDRRVTGLRIQTEIEIEWEGMVGKRTGSISDISSSGCFILCSGEVEDGEQIKIYFPLTDGRKIQFWGEVVNHVFEIGFAAKFIELTESQAEFLDFFVDMMHEAE